MKTLVLPVKKKWFDLIKSGEKTEEYRLCNEYWKKRLEGKQYSKIVVTLGYPPRDCKERRIEFCYTGWSKTIVHSPEWNMKPVEVYAIHLTNEPEF